MAAVTSFPDIALGNLEDKQGLPQGHAQPGARHPVGSEESRLGLCIQGNARCSLGDLGVGWMKLGLLTHRGVLWEAE